MSSFTLDEFERALRHGLVDPPCRLLSEIHVALLNVIAEKPFDRHCAVVSLMDLKNVESTPYDKDDDWQVEIDELLAALADVGVSWEVTLPALVGDEKREGWENTLVGVLKDVSDVIGFSRRIEFMTLLSTLRPQPSLDFDLSSPRWSMVPALP